MQRHVKHAGSLKYMCSIGGSLAPRLLGSGVGGAYSSGSISVLDIEGPLILNTVLKICEHRLWNRDTNVLQHIISVACEGVSV